MEDGWERFWDENHQAYYLFNRATGESKWDEVEPVNELEPQWEGFDTVASTTEGTSQRKKKKKTDGPDPKGREEGYLWIHANKFQLKSRANELAHGVLSTFKWWNKRLGEVVDKFAISAEVVVRLHDEVFLPLDFAEEGTIEVCELLEAIKEPRTEMFDYLLKTTGAKSVAMIDFADYMTFVVTLAMFGPEEMTALAFAFGDKEQQAFLDAEAFKRMVEGVRAQRRTRTQPSAG